MSSDDDLGAAYARWNQANEQYKAIDAELAEVSEALRVAEQEMWAIFDLRPRTAWELFTEERDAALAPSLEAHQQAVKSAEDAYHSRVEEAKALLRLERARIEALFAEREATLEDEEPKHEWTSVEFEASKARVAQIRAVHGDLSRRRTEARHELNDARKEKRRASGDR